MQYVGWLRCTAMRIVDNERFIYNLDEYKTLAAVVL